jgi:hypothetical protein
VHRIYSDGCGPPENWEKFFWTPPQEWNMRSFDQRCTQYSQRGGSQNRGRGHNRGPYAIRPLYCMFHGNQTYHRIKDCPIFLASKRKMEHDAKQPPQQYASREVNHTMHWTPPHQQYSPSYSSFPQQTYSNNQAQAPVYYQSYHYAITNHA